MNDSKLARQQSGKDHERAETGAESTAPEIRLLDDLELALAGGGDGVVTWP